METQLVKRKRDDGDSDEYIYKRRCDDCIRVYINEEICEFTDTFDCISFFGVRCYVSNDRILNFMLEVAPTRDCSIEIVRYRRNDGRYLSVIRLSDILDCRPTLESRQYVVSNFKRFWGCWFANVTITGSDEDGYSVWVQDVRCIIDTISEAFTLGFDRPTLKDVSFDWQ